MALPFQSKRGGGVRSTLPQPKSAAPEKQCANSRYKSNILISLKEDISFSTTALEKHLSDWSPQLQHWQDMVTNQFSIQLVITRRCASVNEPDRSSATQQVKEKRVARAHAHEAREELKNCSWTSDLQPGMHPATEFQNLRHPQTHLRITDCKWLRPSRHPFLLILSEIKVQTKLQNGNIWQPPLIFWILLYSCKIKVQIQILGETSVSHAGPT